jgi:hypothetical protein
MLPVFSVRVPGATLRTPTGPDSPQMARGQFGPPRIAFASRATRRGQVQTCPYFSVLSMFDRSKGNRHLGVLDSSVKAMK